MAHALHCLGLALAGWGNRHHEDRIDYLRDRLAQEEIDEAGGVIRLASPLEDVGGADSPHLTTHRRGAGAATGAPRP